MKKTGDLNYHVMKKLSIILCVLLAIPFYARAFDAYIDGIYYNLDKENHRATVTNNLPDGGVQYEEGCYQGEITIPETIKIGKHVYTVEAIGKNAFNRCYHLDAIHFGKNVRSIGDVAFAYCQNLQSVCIPNQLKEFGSSVFTGCSNLESVVVDDGVECLGKSMFFSCTRLKSIQLGEGMIVLAASCFSQCTALEEVRLPNSLERIDSYAFSSCESLRTVVFGTGLKSIGQHAFWWCESLMSISFPSGLQRVKDGAFMGCTSIQSVHAPSLSDWLHISFEDETSNPLNYTHHLYIDGQLVQRVDVPSDVTSIKQYAFVNCEDIKSVSVPEHVKSVSWYSFKGCNQLKTVVVNSHDVCQHSYLCNVFGRQVESYTVGGNVTKIGHDAFWDCEYLTAVTLPHGLVAIDKSAFCNCQKLRSVHLPESLEYIGYSAFLGCSSLESIVVPDKVSEMGHFVFEGCTSLRSVVLSNSLKEVPYSAFSKCKGLEEVVIPEGVEVIGSDAFVGCGKLKEVTFPGSLFVIGGSAFSECKSLESVTFDSNRKIIFQDYAFSGCTSLSKVVISDLEAWCNSSFEVQNYQPYSNPLIYAHRLYLGSEHIEDLVVPTSIERLNEYTFAGADVKTITLHQDVKCLDEGAFFGCKEFTDVYCYRKDRIPSANMPFINCNVKNATLHAYEDLLPKYKDYDDWRGFKEYVPLDETGILQHQLPSESEVYTIDGRKVHGQLHGLNIVRQNNGILRKIIVK